MAEMIPGLLGLAYKEKTGIIPSVLVLMDEAPEQEEAVIRTDSLRKILAEETSGAVTSRKALSYAVLAADSDRASVRDDRIEADTAGKII